MEDKAIKTCFHASYVTDVKFYEKHAQLQDSGRLIWNVDLSNKDVLPQFKTWLRSVFLKGLPQTLTVFEYEDRSDGVDFEYWITKFFNIPVES